MKAFFATYQTEDSKSGSTSDQEICIIPDIIEDDSYDWQNAQGHPFFIGLHEWSRDYEPLYGILSYLQCNSLVLDHICRIFTVEILMGICTGLTLTI